MATIDEICHSVLGHNPTADTDLIRRCYAYAAESHAGQFRRSGDPYLVHPMGVAKIIADLNLDVSSICAGILHDCVEDTTATPEDIREKFGADIQTIVDGVTKLGQIPWTTREERQAENFRKMLLAMARDIRVILVKLADRVNNMRTLEFMSRDKQERIARETREIYAPIANRLGLQWMKVELEDLSFKFLEPQDWENLRKQMEGTEAERSAYIRDVCAKLSEVLAENDVKGQVSGRAKGYWSIHQKMKRTGRDLEQVYDIIAFRVITDSVRDCYAALGIIHSNWTPVPGRFKDYVALPKPNLYQSLHTTVIGPGSERMEVQIRTHGMHQVAEEGIAAHWQYKERSPLGSEDRKAFAWLHQLMEWQRDLKDPAEFIQTVKIDLFEEEVFVFTPKGDVKALPKGATPIDFSYAVHSKIGDHCSGARVNGMMVPLRYPLRNGDTVDIITSPTQRPSKDWLKFVVTSRAQTKIRHHLRKEQRERSHRLGRDLLTKALRNHHRSLAVAEKDKLLDKAAEALHLGSPDEIFVHIGYGKLSPEAAALAIYPQLQSADVTSDSLPAASAETRTQPRRESKRSVGGVRVQGEADIVVRFAKCCSPVPGDAIVAFISRGRGVIVHTRQCSKAFNLDPARSVEVSWDEETRLLRPVAVEVVSEDKPGILAALSKCFLEHGVNIVQAKCRATEDNRGLNTFQVTVNHVDQLSKVLRAIREIDGVISAERL
ncbi:MAG TPA: bifunctional (p)ppGpp synthetase/guanosine-3',5'-bis(diphosphate) 3'-pyrophosphohydrolase [Polyangia bacterium]